MSLSSNTILANIIFVVFVVFCVFTAAVIQSTGFDFFSMLCYDIGQNQKSKYDSINHIYGSFDLMNTLTHTFILVFVMLCSLTSCLLSGLTSLLLGLSLDCNLRQMIVSNNLLSLPFIISYCYISGKLPSVIWQLELLPIG